ncbi:FAD/NAD(P)-binding domain-containing protein [Trichoderma citrinoviride]|uniref:FAD/NAD(P)-binding domain-containing protein n=1 Tax=Trichoderma citrinoviride TaxID=58853 RepID=A0A2T4BI53_9HYPO|nr:FAD/NAD(P)-binding domain-containing protein [Trichoderma citrinoviride]PTB69006.1 FAD/NAD(P)-binding domain-containing protein [Trichoderma citrinoviride]
MTVNEKPVLIIGAGVVGLTLAHGLKKANIPFEIYERDQDIDARGQGYAITLHWVLRFLRDMLDEETLAAIDGVQVDPEVGRNDNGNFMFINLKTLETKFRIPPNLRRRVNREKLRKVLLRGVADHVRWGKKLADIRVSGDDDDDDDHDNGGVTATFADGSSATGRMLVGAEGSNSQTRRFLVPDAYRNYLLPVKMIGASADFTPDQVAPLRRIDPLLFQGCHPDTGVFLWISMLETPEANGTAGTPAERYRVQVMLSWLDKDRDEAVPESNQERVALMKRLAAGFHPDLHGVIQAIPESSPTLHLVLQDWPCQDWDNRDGRVTLAGDAAHAMVMYRGEAGNHGILDAWHLLREIKAVYSGEKARAEAVGDYEKEMKERATPAVLLSRQACLDAHDYDGLNENSAVLKKRAINA